MLSSYTLHVITMGLFYAYLATAWNLVGGLAGQHSLGHSLFVGIGAYVSTLLFIHLGLTPWLGIFFSVAVACSLALFIGFLTFRYGLRGPYFLLVTLAFAEVAKIIVANSKMMGASSGLNVPLRGDAPLLFQFEQKWPYLLIALCLCLGAVALTRTIRRSWFGHSLLALNDNEGAARACGVSVERQKLAIFVLSAALSAIGGTFYAQYTLFIEPQSLFGIGLSVEMILFTIVGGIGTIYGPAIGALVLYVIAESTRSLVGLSSIGNLHLIVYSVILLIVVMAFPGGIAGAARTIQRRLRRAAAGPGTEAPSRTMPDVAISPEPRPAAPRGVGEAVLVAEDLTKRFGGLTAVSHVNLRIGRGECVGVIGPNGSGKSTFLNIMAGALAADSGRILLDGEAVSGLRPEEMCRRGVGRTHQIAQPFGDLTARENIMVGAFARTRSRAEAVVVAEQLLTRLGIGHLADSPVRVMTSADRKKIEIARALATGPHVLLLDEALAGLTEHECERMIGLLLELRREGLTLVVVEHIMRVVTALCDRAIFLNFGKVLAEGTPDEVLRHPEVIRAYLGTEESDDATPRG